MKRHIHKHYAAAEPAAAYIRRTLKSIYSVFWFRTHRTMSVYASTPMCRRRCLQLFDCFVHTYFFLFSYIQSACIFDLPEPLYQKHRENILFCFSSFFPVKRAEATIVPCLSRARRRQRRAHKVMSFLSSKRACIGLFFSGNENNLFWLRIQFIECCGCE